MSELRIDLIYFQACSHADAARANLRTALSAADVGDAWQEWDLESEETPDRFKRYGSPTILVDGEDVLGGGPGPTAGLACRREGAPSVEAIRRAMAD